MTLRESLREKHHAAHIRSPTPVELVGADLVERLVRRSGVDGRDDVDPAVEFDHFIDERARHCGVLQIVATDLERSGIEWLFAPRHLGIVR